MKIVHLSNDEKFLPLTRSLFEEAFPGQNRYLIAGAGAATRAMSSRRLTSAVTAHCAFATAGSLATSRRPTAWWCI